MSIKSKIGAMVKLIANQYWDRKLIGNRSTLNKDLSSIFNWSTKVQSIDYLYLIESLKDFQIVKNDTFLDLGCGKGRALLYCNHRYNELEKKDIVFHGAEISKEAHVICKKMCINKNMTIENINALDNDYIVKHKFNKILLFNPFDENIFFKFVQYLQENINYPCSFLYINISQKQIDILNKKNINFEKYSIHRPLFGIWNKINVVVSFNES
ncbi:MAG: class I SAM-dependent methyltransferase [Sulfurovum sp.]|nr:class I SAM-dependent methyltransferase [Sulfurovum sp.]